MGDDDSTLTLLVVAANVALGKSDFPNATFVGERTISLPLSPAMSERDVADVVSALIRIFRYYKISA